jgi:hypothetical protein
MQRKREIYTNEYGVFPTSQDCVCYVTIVGDMELKIIKMDWSPMA